jgi:hypothetical protein
MVSILSKGGEIPLPRWLSIAPAPFVNYFFLLSSIVGPKIMSNLVHKPESAHLSTSTPINGQIYSLTDETISTYESSIPAGEIGSILPMAVF